jgi:polysaccharide biosynthesis transport protein
MPYYDGNSSESPLHLPEPSSPQGPANHALTAAGGSSAYGAAVPASPLPPALAAAPDVMSLLKALKRHWLAAATLGLLAATAASAAVWYLMPVKWTAEAILALNSTRLVKVGLDDNKESASPFSKDTLIALAKARYVLQAVLTETDIVKLPSIREQLDPVGWLRSRLEVSPISSELISISLTGTDPRELEQLVDAVARVYETKLGEAERKIRNSRVIKLQNMIDKLQGIVDLRKEAYRAAVIETGLANSGQVLVKANFHEMLLQALLKEKVSEQNKLQKLELTLKQIKERKGGPGRISAVELDKALKEKPAYQSLLSKIASKQRELVDREEVYKDINHPMLQELRKEIMKLQKEKVAARNKLIPEVKQELKDFHDLLGEDSEVDTEDEIAATKQYIGTLTDEMTRLGELVKKQGSYSFELDEKKAAYETEKAVQMDLGNTRARLNAELQEAASTAQVQDKAHAYQSQNVKKQIMLAGGAGGAALGLVLLAFAYWEFRVRRINCVEDVVYGLGWRLVGQLPALPDHSRGGLLRRQADPRYWQSLMTESVDATRTMILHAARVEGIRTVMVTSAVSGEGKTSLSCHLACSLARAGRKTLLLDCDLRNPAAHRLFELPGEPGLCEVLRGEAQLGEVIRATPANNLWLIPAGQFDEQALQMLTLSREGFSPLLERLKTQFDFIVVDSSPVLPVVDSLVIGQNVDVVVFSLLRDVSRIPSVYAAYQRLATLDIHILGAVVNGVDTGTYGYTPRYYAKQAV